MRRKRLEGWRNVQQARGVAYFNHAISWLDTGWVGTKCTAVTPLHRRSSLCRECQTMGWGAAQIMSPSSPALDHPTSMLEKAGRTRTDNTDRHAVRSYSAICGPGRKNALSQSPFSAQVNPTGFQVVQKEPENHFPAENHAFTLNLVRGI